MKYSEKMMIVVNNLRKSRKVNSLDQGEEFESATLAHAFLDIEKTCVTLLNLLFPKLLLNNLSGEEVEEILIDIGEEFRHILYHIKDPKFYEYLKDL